MALFLNGKKLSGEPHNYSTDEQIVGTWIDGSTIYEKVIDFGSDTNISQTQWVPTTLTGFSNIIQCSTVNTAGTYYPLMASIQSDYVNLLACRDGNPVAARYIIIRYTKSST